MHTARLTTRGLIAAAVASAAGLLAGCPPAPTLPSQTQPSVMRPATGTGAASVGDAPVLGVEPLSGGVYESLGSTNALTGEALTRARMDRRAIRALVTLKAHPPTTMPATALASAPATQPDEPPSQAVKYYLKGRERFMQGANSEAMDFLEKALQLDPDAFTVLRLMGRVCFAAAQLPRGSMYLERAQLLRPDDVEVNYLLGRYWQERKDFERAVYYLMRADDSPERLTSSTQTPLSAFYLARALQAGGFHRAAAAEYERYLEIAALPVSGYRYDRELSYLIDEGWAAHLAAAENDALAGDYAAALPHYRAAAASETKDVFIASRLVNALAHLGQMAAAREAALDFLNRSGTGASGTAGGTVGGGHISDEAIQLLGWTFRASGKEGELIAQLRARLNVNGAAGRGDDASVVLTLAAAQEYLGHARDAFQTLAGYLADHPTNLDVLRRLLDHVDSAESFGEALQVAGRALEADRSVHDAVVRLMVPLTELPPAAAFVRWEDAQSHVLKGYGALYLFALTLRTQNAPAAAIDSFFKRALNAAPDFAPLRNTYVGWLLAQEKFPEAATLVQQAVAADPNNPKAWELLVQSEASQQRLTSALKLAQDAKKKFPNNPDTRYQLAAVYRLRGQDVEADAELLSLVNDQPTFEPGYRALVDSLYIRSRRTGLTSTTMSTLITVLAKMNAALPDSRYAQVNTAIVLRISDRLPEAEAILRRLLQDAPDDVDVLITLANVRQGLGRSADAISTLQNAIKAHPKPGLVQALASLYRDRLGKSDEALAVTRQAYEEHPEVEAYTLAYAGEMAGQEKRTEAIAFLQAAAKKFPRSDAVVELLARQLDLNDDHEGAVLAMQAFMRANGDTTERLMLLSHYFSTAGNEDAAAAAMQRVLTIMPDHAGANNDLGYFWVDAGIHLDEADKMIRKAVDAEPNNAAYQDSLGWLLYKQGKFAEAATALQKAVSLPSGNVPDVIGHLADALYRAGRQPEAFENWSRAAQMLTRPEGLSRSDMKTRDYLRKVIATVREGKEPEVSPLGLPAGALNGPSTQSAGQATAPARRPQ